MKLYHNVYLVCGNVYSSEDNVYAIDAPEGTILVDTGTDDREYEIIKFMAQNPGKVVSRQELMSEVWQYDYYGDLRTVDVAVRRLREKLENNPAEPEYVITKRGAGYYIAE